MYEWENAPEWAQYAATSSNGKAIWYELKPKIAAGISGGKLSAAWVDFNKGRRAACEGRIHVPWKNSLEKRPEKSNITHNGDDITEDNE